MVFSVVACTALTLTSCEREKTSSRIVANGAVMERSSGHETAPTDTDPTRNWPERYQGRPLMVVLENYALDVIGKLPPGKEAKLVEITRRVWDGGTDWKATLRRAMAWDSNIDLEIRSNWDEFRAAAKKQGVPADAEVFARAFADEIASHSAR